MCSMRPEFQQREAPFALQPFPFQAAQNDQVRQGELRSSMLEMPRVDGQEQVGIPQVEEGEVGGGEVRGAETEGHECGQVDIDSFCERDKPKVVALLKNQKKPRKKRLPKEGQEYWLPLRMIFGTANIPESAADVILQGIEKMKEAGDITNENKWQYIEFLSAQYLAGE